MRRDSGTTETYINTKARPRPDWSDEALALAAAQDPEDPDARRAAGILLGRYAQRVYRWCYHWVGHQELARDLVQDILLSVYRNLGRFERGRRFSGWLYVICRNRCTDVLRRSSPVYDDEADLDALADRRPTPEQETEEHEEEDRLLILVREHLTPLEQEALWLRCFERLPVDAITTVLGIRHAAGARAVLQTARRKLRAAIGAASTSPRPTPGLSCALTASEEMGAE